MNFLTAFAGLASLVYVLGLFVLLGPIMETYTHDFLTAWHAVSLAPKIVVAGLGVEQLVAFPLLLMTLTYVLLGVIGFTLSVLRQIASPQKPKNKVASWFRFVACTMTAWGFLAIGIAWYVDSYLPRGPILHVLDTFFQFVGIVSLIVSGLIGAFVITGTEQDSPHHAHDLVVGIATLTQLPKPKGVEPKNHTLPSLGSALHSMLTSSQARAQARASCRRALQNRALLKTVVSPRVGIWILIVLGFWFIQEKIAAFFPHLVTVAISSITDYLVFFVVVIVAFIVVWYTAHAYYDPSSSSASSRVSKGWLNVLHSGQKEIKSFIAIGLVLSFLMAFLLTFLRHPPLPKVQVSGDTNARGKLLVHTEGFWYVYKGKGELVAIPDSKVKAVRVSATGE